MKQDLIALHEAITQHFLILLKEGSITSKDLEAAIRFLKDNGINVDSSNPETNISSLVKNFPFEAEVA